MSEGNRYTEIYTVLEPYEASLILLLGFGSLAIGLALLYNFIRRKFYSEADSLDRTFDAGGNVSFSLTAVTVAVQLLWPADLLQSSSVATKYGIAGGFWYSTAVVVNIILFPFLSITFKTRAPGAKTYLQVIKARFGPAAHIVYCAFALLTNFVILSVLLIAGHGLFKSLVSNISDELIMLIFATLFGSYSFVGGLGSTFYVSYANALITFVILCVYILEIFYIGDDADLPFGTMGEIYEKVIALEGPKDNEDRSYLTFWSGDSLVWAVQGVFIAASVTFCDQASWQSRIAAKPMQGVLGFFFATFLWFAIPATLGTTSGILYLAYTEGGNLTTALSDSDIDKGLVTPYIAQVALGRGGGVMVIIMFTMLMMGTGSGEIMGVSSIIVYDIYQSYVKPFRRNAKSGCCVLCGLINRSEKSSAPSLHLPSRDTTLSLADSVTTLSFKKTDGFNNNMTSSSYSQSSLSPEVEDSLLCQCIPVSDCFNCDDDLQRITEAKKVNDKYTKAVPRCPNHGLYRIYQAELVRIKSWVLLWVTICLVPVGLLMVRTGIDLNWIFMTGCIVTIQTFPGVVLSIVWVKTTAVGLIFGALLGMASGVTACLARASTLEGGLGEFLLNTSEGYAVMSGSCVNFFVSLIVAVIISLFTHKIKTQADIDAEWQKLRDVDNCLSPWADIYKDDFPDLPRNQRPTHVELDLCFRKAKMVALIGCIACLLLFVVIIPGAMAALHVMSSAEFRSFLTVLQIWTFVMAIICVLLVPVQEIKNILTQMRKSRIGF